MSDLTIQRRAANNLIARLVLTGVIIVVLFLGLVVRMWMLQTRDREDYQGQANSQSRRLVVIPAPRGNIYDRHGKLLVANRPMFSIAADISMLRGEFDTEFVRLRRTDPLLKELMAAVRMARTKTEREALNAPADARSAELRTIASVNVLQQRLDKLNRIFRRGEGEKLTLDLKRVGNHLSKASGRRAVPFVLVRDISEEEVARFIECEPPGSPLLVQTESARTYPLGMTAAHVLGYVSSDRSDPLAPADNANEDAELAQFLALDPKVKNRNTLKRFDGQRPVSGVEARFDEDCLRGTPGYQLWTVRPNGFAYAIEAQAPPRQGAHLRLSLDIELQQAVEQELATRFPQNRASVVLLDVRTGEVLVCANSPSFDPAKMNNRDYIAKYLADYDELFNPLRSPGASPGAGAWLNHATQGLYPPGSSFKPVTALAALRSGLFTPDTVKECDSYYEIAKKKFIEHDRRAFGSVNITRMLQVSSNVFCYQAGLDIGIERLADEAKRFGLGEKTTIELVSQRGQVPTPEMRRRRTGEGWSLGDTANTAIGQGDLETTPMHLAAMIASLARNETLTDVTIVHDPSRQKNYKHRGIPIGLAPAQYKAVVDGLVACGLPGGTGSRVTPGLGGLTVATKTGTAQIKRNTANLAWVLAYAPVEKPEVALAVLVEGKDGNRNFGGGANAGPVANRVLTEWLKHRNVTQFSE